MSETSGAADQQFTIIDHFLGQTIVKIDEELLVFDDFPSPSVPVEFLELAEFLP
jgi:hypothetical protein